MNKLKEQLSDLTLHTLNEEGTETIPVVISQPGNCLLFKLRLNNEEEILSVSPEQVRMLHAYLSTIV